MPFDGIIRRLKLGMQPASVLDFYDIKGDIALLLRHLGVELQFVSAEHPALHPGKSAKLIQDRQCVGWCGVLHPEIAASLGLETEVMLFEYAFGAKVQHAYKSCCSPSKFPAIRRDIACLMEQSIPFSQVEAVIRSAAAEFELLKSVNVFDVYTGKGVPAGKKSIAIALGLQSNAKTLTDKDINDVMDKIIGHLKTTLAITLRDGGQDEHLN